MSRLLETGGGVHAQKRDNFQQFSQFIKITDLLLQQQFWSLSWDTEKSHAGHDGHRRRAEEQPRVLPDQQGSDAETNIQQAVAYCRGLLLFNGTRDGKRSDGVCVTS